MDLPIVHVSHSIGYTHYVTRNTFSNPNSIGRNCLLSLRGDTSLSVTLNPFTHFRNNTASHTEILLDQICHYAHSGASQQILPAHYSTFIKTHMIYLFHLFVEFTVEPLMGLEEFSPDVYFLSTGY